MEAGGIEKAGSAKAVAPSNAPLVRGPLIGPQPAASAPKAFPSGVPAASSRTQATPLANVAPANINQGLRQTTPRRHPVVANNHQASPRKQTSANNDLAVSRTQGSNNTPASPGRPLGPANSRGNDGSPRHQNRRPPRQVGDRDHELSTKPDPLRILVTGYPPFSQPQDLTRVFAKFGAVKLDKLANKFATLSYATDDEARAAVKASMKVNVYGEFLTVRPYSEATFAEFAAKHNPNKRDFAMSKQKTTLIDPKQLDLSGDFGQQLDRILAAVRLTQEDVHALTMLYTDLETALQSQWPGCTAVPFGSITTGLGVKSSDADCFIHVPPQFRHPHANFVNKAKRVLQQYPDVFAEILSIPRANTPIVKLFHIPTQTNADLTFKTPLGAQNSKLIAFLLHSDPRLIPMAVAIKYWAKVHEFSGTGKLTNYALTLLIIFYLQQPPMSILPSVEWLQRDASNDIIVDYWNTGFMCRQGNMPPSSNTSSISELIGGFFEYYSMFNFDDMAVCTFMGTPIKKDAFQDLNLLPAEFERYKSNVLGNLVLPMRSNTAICVQDPFEQCHNVASAINGKLAAEIKAYFKFAANAYEKEKLASCENFFETILLQKPKIIRAKGHPEYRVNLFPRIIVTIIDPDWKPVVREVVFTIFEKILKIKLGKVEEKVNMDTKKEKEKYMGNVTKAIWRRKQFSRLYSVMEIGFQEKQTRITEEIFKVDKETLAVQFQLTLTLCSSPRSAVLAVKLAAGDLAAFRDFGKFFISVMQGWFINLLRPYARPPERDTAAKIADTIAMLDAPDVDVDDSDDDDRPVPDARKQNDDSQKNDALQKSDAIQQNDAVKLIDALQQNDAFQKNDACEQNDACQQNDTRPLDDDCPQPDANGTEQVSNTSEPASSSS